MVGAGIFLINMFFKEIWLIDQLPINFSYTFDARFVKHAFMVNLSMFTGVIPGGLKVPLALPICRSSIDSI